MVAFNISVDDSSPLISYIGGWADTPLGDSLAQSYLAHSLHTSSAKGATATFKFNGTGIWLYGGHRPNYGTYNLTVDGKPVIEGKASSSNNAIGQLLGGARSLGMGEHTAVLTIAGTGPIDLDNLIFETHIGSTPGHVNHTRLDDGDSRIHYLPKPSSWEVSNNKMYSNGTVHFSHGVGDRASISFTGDAVAVYGGSSFDHGDYTVSIGDHVRHLNGGSKGSVDTYHPQTLLFFATNLGSDSHNLTITNHGSGGAKFIDLDSIVVYCTNGTASMSGPPGDSHVSTASPTSNGQQVINMPGNSNSVGHGHSLPAPRTPSKAVIIGVVMTSILSFCVLFAVIYLCCCRRKKEAGSSSSTPGKPDLDLEAAKEGPYPGHITPFDPDSISQFYIGSPPPESPEDIRQPPVTEDTPVYIGARYSGGLPAEHFPEHLPDHARWSLATFDSTAATLKVEEPPKFTFPPAMPLATPPPQTGRTGGSMYSESDMDFADYYQQVLTPQRPEHTLELEHDYAHDSSKETPAKPPGLEKNFRGSTFDFVRV